MVVGDLHLCPDWGSVVVIEETSKVGVGGGIGGGGGGSAGNGGEGGASGGSGVCTR